jgi:PQQ-like domain/Caspase domain
MDERASSPQTTLVILLGASEWPEFSDFHGSQAFVHVSADFSRYILDPQQFGLPRENFLNLFDTDLSPDKIDKEIRQFLDRRTSEMKQVGKGPTDLLFYFVGHGGFVGRNSEYYLAVRCTSSANPAVSGIRIEPLATTITDRARYLRRLIILDCCYAAAAFTAFQAEGPAQVAIRQTFDVFKEKAKRVGKDTSLLCSSGKKVPSLLLAEDDYTMFSRALLHVLSTRGNPYRPDEAYLSLREVADHTEEVLDSLLEEQAPRPELHSPDQIDGDVADVPFFPNPAARAARASANIETSSVAENLPQSIIHGQPSQERSDLPSMQTQLPAGSASPTSRDQLHLSFPRAFISGSKSGGKAAGVLFRRGTLRGRVMLSLVLVFILLIGSVLLYTTVTISNTNFRATATATAAANALAAAVAANGIMFGFDAAHSHFNPYERILSPATVPHLKQSWTAQTRSKIPSSPAVANGVVFVGSNDGKLYTFVPSA